MSPSARMTLSIALILIGVVSGLILLGASLLSSVYSLLRVTAPGSQELLLERGDYTVYWEIPESGGRLIAPDVKVGIRSPAGQDIALSRPGVFVSRYSTFDRRGMSIASFTIAEPGIYSVSASGAKDGSIALTPSMGILGMLKMIAIPLALMAGGVLAGVILLTRRP